MAHVSDSIIFPRDMQELHDPPSFIDAVPSSQGYLPENARHPYTPTADSKLPISGTAMTFDYLQSGQSDRLTRNAASVVEEGVRYCGNCKKWSDGPDAGGDASPCPTCDCSDQWHEVRQAIPAVQMEMDYFEVVCMKAYDDNRACADYDGSGEDKHLKSLTPGNYMAPPRSLFGLAVAERYPGEFRKYAYDPDGTGVGGEGEEADSMRACAAKIEEAVRLTKRAAEVGTSGNPYVYDLNVARHIREHLTSEYPTALIYSVKFTEKRMRRVPATFQVEGILKSTLAVVPDTQASDLGDAIPDIVRCRFFRQSEYEPTSTGATRTYVVPLVDEEVWDSWSAEWEHEYEVKLNADPNRIYHSTSLAFEHGTPLDMDELAEIELCTKR